MTWPRSAVFCPSSWPCPMRSSFFSPLSSLFFAKLSVVLLCIMRPNAHSSCVSSGDRKTCWREAQKKNKKKGTKSVYYLPTKALIDQEGKTDGNRQWKVIQEFSRRQSGKEIKPRKNGDNSIQALHSKKTEKFTEK